LRWNVATLAPVCVTLLAGCGIMRMNVVVELDETLTRNPASVPTIEVDLVGVSESEMPQWKGYAMSAYWSPGDKLRTGGARHELRFSQTTASRRTLSRDDPIFDTWQEKTAGWLFVLADLPDVPEPAPGEPDPRRMILPLNRKAWKLKKDTITITVKSGQLVCTPAPITDAP
jgi:hypothetical protein